MKGPAQAAAHSTSGLALFGIHSMHARRLYDGTKQVELRKVFPQRTVGIVFLYETEPVGAITGAFLVASASKMAVADAIRAVKPLGIPGARAEKYLAGREWGWVIRVAGAFRFACPVSVAEARELNVYFSVPRSFCYLERAEALTQELLRRLVEAVSPSVELLDASESTRKWLRTELPGLLRTSYDDVDDDFLAQVLDDRSVDASFSTVAKLVLEIRLGRTVLGAAVLTEKAFGSFKSGPVLLKDEYRGVGLGAVVRAAVADYCKARAARRLYCTCPANRTGVARYLIGSGMGLEARLRAHLASDRDELVFARDLDGTGAESQPRPGNVLPIEESEVGEGSVVEADSAMATRAIDYVDRHLAGWYFHPPAGFRSALTRGVSRWANEHKVFSRKARLLTVSLDRADSLRAVVVGTLKRSNMLKLNVVSQVEDAGAIRCSVEAQLAATRGVRRVYLTLPVDRLATILRLAGLGFRFEGILRAPFVAGVDHVCLGLLTGDEGALGSNCFGG